MYNLVKRIIKFNNDAGLLKSGYNDLLESSMLVEEALEGFEGVMYINPETSTTSHKEVSREIVETSGEFTGSDVDRLDKACDAVVIAIGSMVKLNLNENQILEAINIVMDSNMTKIGCKLDNYGKGTKPKDFVGPEYQLQKILDKRK